MDEATTEAFKDEWALYHLPRLTVQAKTINSKYDAKYRISKATEPSYVVQDSVVKQ